MCKMSNLLNIGRPLNSDTKGESNSSRSKPEQGGEITREELREDVEKMKEWIQILEERVYDQKERIDELEDRLGE